jgi:hypothetical protein
MVHKQAWSIKNYGYVSDVSPADDLGRVISDALRGCDTEKERLQFEQML